MSKTADKLEIEWALLAKTSTEIHQLAAVLDDPTVFQEWRELCQRDAVYVTAITRAERTARRKAKA